MKRTIIAFFFMLAAALTNLSAQEDKTMQKWTSKQDTSLMHQHHKMPMDTTKVPLNKEDMWRKDLEKGTDRNLPRNHGDMDKKMPRGDKNTMDKKMPMGSNNSILPDLTGWPEASRMAVEEITGKYGQPDGVTDDELIWWNKGVWTKICITKKETKHSFPIEHTDMMQTSISYQVPEDKMDELGKFDGSVTFDRTQGMLSARCDVEANNILALNLAHDIIQSKLTVYQARFAFANIVKQKMKGENPAYMQKLNFSAQPNAADPDSNTTGLSKADVAKAMLQKKGKK